MSRILILLLFLVWLIREPGQTHTDVNYGLTLPAFFGFYVLLVFIMGLWGRWLARRVAGMNFQRSLRRFNFTMEAARVLIPAWFGVGVLLLGWAELVERWMGPDLIQSLPGVLLGTLPAIIAWVGLWWSQYPADRALREQNMLCLLDAEQPVYEPQGFASYFSSNLRLQLLFIGVPVLLIVFGHDIALLAIRLAGLRHAAADIGEFVAWLGSAGLVFFFAPEILRRVLHTEPLPDTPLRRRLDAMCRRAGVRYRDVLLWKTNHNMGNAAVMGFVPRLRYILLSDVLIEQMPDDEIEAVFAHEMGHIVHRHMAWYVIFIVALTLINAGPGKWLADSVAARVGYPAVQPVIVAGFVIAKFLLLFGFVSRRFERQADVYAARTIQTHRGHRELKSVAVASAAPVVAAWEVASIADGAPLSVVSNAPVEPISAASPDPFFYGAPSYVGQYGATLFGAALRRVAMVNNIPIVARSWCHGSIATRMDYLQSLSSDPQRTARFDRFMFWMYATMVIVLLASTAMFAMTGLPR